MAKMMMGQIDHARARISVLKREKIGKAPDEVKDYSISDLVSGFRDGTVVFSGPQLQKFVNAWVVEYFSSLSRYNQPKLEDIILENAFASERAADKERFDAENLVYQNLVRSVRAEATKVEDAIVLGDNAAALAALQAFAAFKP